MLNPVDNLFIGLNNYIKYIKILQAIYHKNDFKVLEPILITQINFSLNKIRSIYMQLLELAWSAYTSHTLRSMQLH